MTEQRSFDDVGKLNASVDSYSRQETQAGNSDHAEMIRRSALWSAYGDALGWISELTDEAGLKRRTSEVPLHKPIEWKRRIGGRTGVTVTVPQGCYSDDSQLRLATGRSIRSDGFDVESFSKVELPVWLSYALGAGKSTSAAATNLARRRVQWFANTFDGWTNSGGNGAAMRIQPHVWAARTPDDPTSFIPDVVRNSICTHSHPRGLLGATFHALTLAHTMTAGYCPSPDELMAATDVAAKLPDIIRGDIEVWNYWRSTFERESGTFEEAWTRAIDECREAIQAASGTSGSGTDRYAAIVDRLGLRDPARRGDGTLTAVAAVGLTWCETQPEQALSVAANALGTDTDTIATMAGAILGLIAEEEPPVEILDTDLFRSEANRLADIACGGKPPGHRYPDLLHWSAPKGRADALVHVDGGDLYVRGFGRAQADGAPMPSRQDKFSWQWVKLGIGQTLLIKRRSKLAKIDEEDRGFAATQSLDQAPLAAGHSTMTPVGPLVTDDVSSIDDAPSQSLLKDRTKRSNSQPDLEAMIDHLEKHNYEDRVVGQAIRRVVKKCTASQTGAFLAVLIKRLSELSDPPPN